MFTANATTAGCSPRWIIYPNSRATGALSVREAVTLEQCLDTCVADSRCVALDWNARYAYKCWLHDRLAYRYLHSRITHFEIVNRCNVTSGQLLTIHNTMSQDTIIRHRISSVDVKIVSVLGYW